MTRCSIKTQLSQFSAENKGVKQKIQTYLLATFIFTISLFSSQPAKAQWTYYGAIAASSVAVGLGGYSGYYGYYGYGMWLPGPYAYVGRSTFVDYKSYEPPVIPLTRTDMRMLVNEVEVRRQNYLQNQQVQNTPTIREQKDAEYESQLRVENSTN